jgi:hypothetical protein
MFEKNCPALSYVERAFCLLIFKTYQKNVWKTKTKRKDIHIFSLW